MLKIIALSILLLALAVLMLGVKVLFVKGSKFPMHLHRGSHRGKNAEPGNPGRH